MKTTLATLDAFLAEDLETVMMMCGAIGIMIAVLGGCR